MAKFDLDFCPQPYIISYLTWQLHSLKRDEWQGTLHDGGHIFVFKNTADWNLGKTSRASMCCDDVLTCCWQHSGNG